MTSDPLLNNFKLITSIQKKCMSPQNFFLYITSNESNKKEYKADIFYPITKLKTIFFSCPSSDHRKSSKISQIRIVWSISETSIKNSSQQLQWGKRNRRTLQFEKERSNSYRTISIRHTSLGHHVARWSCHFGKLEWTS